MKDIATERYALHDIIAEGWTTYKAIFRKSLPILLIVMLPVNWLTEYVIARTNFVTLVEAGKLTEAQAAKVQLQIGNFIQALIGSIAMIALMKLAETHVTRRETTWQEALVHGVVRYPRMLLAGLMFALYILAAIAVCCLPMVLLSHLHLAVLAGIPAILTLVLVCYFSGIFTFFPFAVGLTSASAGKSLRYSKKLVRGQFWRVAFLMLGIGIVCGFFSVLTSSVGWAATSAIGHFFSDIPLPIAVTIDGICDLTGDMAIPFQMSLMTIFFLNTAYLKDGAN